MVFDRPNNDDLDILLTLAPRITEGVEVELENTAACPPSPKISSRYCCKQALADCHPTRKDGFASCYRSCLVSDFEISRSHAHGTLLRRTWSETV